MANTYEEALQAARIINRKYGQTVVFRQPGKSPHYEARACAASDLASDCELIASFGEGELAPLDPQFPEFYAANKAEAA